MDFIVYAIENLQGKLYIGHTKDIQSRLRRHNNELPVRQKSYTKKQGGLWELIYKEKFDTRIEAIRREKELKSSRGRDFLKKFRKYKK